MPALDDLHFVADLKEARRALKLGRYPSARFGSDNTTAAFIIELATGSSQAHHHAHLPLGEYERSLLDALIAEDAL